ncbi:hypothetical protein [Sorangium sp. So ce1182]|uniref:hypothetical protein n=1 Tax=Sorangium sp. So ce1182 TaxID=3133334 RepID=UPI003F6290F3
MEDVEDFEKKWFKETSDSIHCSVPKGDHRDVIEADILKDLTDKPRGKPLIQSAIKYLDRVEKLPGKYADEPRAGYAKTVRDKLGAKGLRDEVVKVWREGLQALLKKQPIVASEPDM